MKYEKMRNVGISDGKGGCPLRGPPGCVMQLAATTVNYVYTIQNCTIILDVYTTYCNLYKRVARTSA